MFDRYEAFKHLDGRRMSFADFMDALGEIRLRNLKDIPPDVGRYELYEIAIRSGWIAKEEPGYVTLSVKR